MNVDPFTPWHESAEDLATRTVGRDDALDWLVRACEAWIDGASRPSWKLVVGSRGLGKSHLVHLACGRLSDPARVVRIGEDTPVHTDADVLWRTIWEPEDRWGWTERPKRPAQPILVIERLDRLLSALRPEGRWTLRHHLQESGAMVVATALDASFAASSGEPFFGQLDTWVLSPLSPAESRTLFLAVSGEVEDDPIPRTLTRRAALIRMSGGNPRAVVTLAEAVRGRSGDALETSEGLLLALQRLVAHYQQRFNDLAPLGQQIVQALATAPRELTSGEVQDITQGTSQAVANAAKGLESAGMLTRHPDADDARVSRYALAEPMFRYWLDYRAMPTWGDTRTAWIGRLLGEVLTRDEIVDVWWRTNDPDLRGAPGRTQPHGIDLLLRLCSEIRAGEVADVRQRLETVEQSEHTALWAMRISDIYSTEHPDLDAWLRRWELPAALLEFRRELEAGGDSKSILRRLVRRIDALCQPEPRHGLMHLVPWVDHSLSTTRMPQGRPWTPLPASDQAVLARVPHLRAHFAAQGRRAGQPPVLSIATLRRQRFMNPVDFAELVDLAHQRRDATLFGNVWASTQHPRLGVCRRPELPALDPDAIASALAVELAPSWAGALVDISEARFLDVLARSPAIAWSLGAEADLTGLLVLASRAPHRFARLADLLGDHPTATRARRIARQLAERANGPLQPELELVWQKLAPSRAGSDG